MNFVNLTPHTIKVVDGEGNIVISVPASGNIARVTVSNQLVETVDGVEIYRAVMGAVVGIPEVASDTIYIVSMVVRQEVPNRSDVASPGELVRDGSGNPVGCRGLVVN